MSSAELGPVAPSRVFAITLGLISLITPLAVHLFFPVIPAVKVALGLSDAHAQFTFSIALFGMAFATLFYGSLSDRYGRRPMLLSGLSLFLIGSVISAMAETANTLLLGRLVQAIGAGSALTLVRAIARDAYRADQLVKAIAYLTMFGTLGPMVSPFIGGLLTDIFGWRSVFGFALAAGAAITLTAYFVMAETHPPARRDTSGDGMLQAFSALFRRLRFNAFVLNTGLNTGAFMVMASASASLMTELLHRPATEFGLYFLLFPVGFFFGNFISTRIGNRASLEAMVLVGSILAMVTVTTQAVVGGQRLGHSGHALHSGLLHHHGAGHLDAVRPGRRHGRGAAFRRHRGRHRRVHAELLCGRILSALRHVRRRHGAADGHDRRLVRDPDLDRRRHSHAAEAVRENAAEYSLTAQQPAADPTPVKRDKTRAAITGHPEAQSSHASIFGNGRRINNRHRIAASITKVALIVGRCSPPARSTYEKLIAVRQSSATAKSSE